MTEVVKGRGKPCPALKKKRLSARQARHLHRLDKEAQRCHTCKQIYVDLETANKCTAWHEGK